MSDWLTRFHSAARRIDAAPLPPPEMPDVVFDALVEGRIGEIDDLETMTPPDEEISFSETRPPLAQRPLMALTLAMLAQALPEASDLARMLRPGAITLMACRPAGLAPELARLVQALIAVEHPGVPLALTCAATPPGTGTASTSEAKPPEAIRSFWKGVLAGGDMPHLLILGGESQLPRRIARLLPPLLHVGPPDRAAVAAVLDLAVTGTARACATGAAARTCGVRGGIGPRAAGRVLPAAVPSPVPPSDLPSDAALRGLEAEAWHLALRAPDPAAWTAELRRLAAGAPARRTATLTLDDLSLEDGPVRDAATRLVADMAGWRAGRVAWSEMTRSLLIHGAPGTGKTWLARAIAGSAGLPLIAASLGDWQAAGHLGDLLREMRATFARARTAAPCVLFLDELDAAGSRGSDDRHASTYRAQVIAGLLEQLDGVLGLEGVLVLAATNDPGAIDPALRRPGRLDRTLALPLPGRSGLHAMLARQLGDALPPEALDDLSRRAIGQSPAEIDAALREARSLARAAGRGITAADIADALGLGPEAPGLMRRMGVHEAGHAVAFHRLRRAGVLAGRITAARIGATGGLVAIEEQAGTPTRVGLEARITCRLAGRAAEALVLGAPGTGAGGDAGSDLALATGLALQLELSWGLGGGLTWHANPMARLAADPHLRDRVEAHLQRGHGRATVLLKESRPLLDALAARLEAERVIEGDPFEDPVTAVAITAGEASRADGENTSTAPTATTAPTARTRTAPDCDTPPAAGDGRSARSVPPSPGPGTGGSADA